MRILVFNWKDASHPRAGGAEVFTHEVTRRWVEQGHSVTLFCAAYDSPTVDAGGVTIIRRGNRWNVYRAARAWYRAEGRGRFDVIMDEINARPFLTPSFVKDAPVVALIHQLGVEVWNEELPFPLSWIGRLVLEPWWLRRYRSVPTATVSASSAAGLRALGFTNVRIVPEGAPATAVFLEKEPIPTLMFLGRLARVKRPGDAIKTLAIVRALIPDTQLWIAGNGYLRDELARWAPPGVTFLGRIAEDEKLTRLSRAHLLLVPSVREGWGLVVTEAAAVGTPSIAYRVPGLIDSVRDGETGVLVDESPHAMADAATALLRDSARLEALAKGARDWARTLTWDATAAVLMEVLEGAIRG